MKFTVDRSTWIAGRPNFYTPTDPNNSCGKGDTYLLNNEGFKCCLGHVCTQLGIPDTKLKGRGKPYIGNGECRYDKYTLSKEMTDAAIIINDDETITLVEKEQRLSQLFHANGHEIEFTGEL